MTPIETKGLLLILTVIILGSGFLLALKVRSHFQHVEREAQREAEGELGSSKTLPLPPNEIWTWPAIGHGAPGEWGGPTERLARFLFELQHPVGKALNQAEKGEKVWIQL